MPNASMVTNAGCGDNCRDQAVTASTASWSASEGQSIFPEVVLPHAYPGSN